MQQHRSCVQTESNRSIWSERQSEDGYIIYHQLLCEALKAFRKIRLSLLKVVGTEISQDTSRGLSAVGHV